MINKYAFLNEEFVESFRLIGIKYNGLSSNRIEITKFKALHRNTYMLIYDIIFFKLINKSKSEVI